MTSGHFFFIPTIFFLGLFAGVAISNYLAQKKIERGKVPLALKVRASLLASIFGVFATIFIITHMFPFPGGAKSLHATLGHQPLFDQRTSSTAVEIYGRLESFGEVGRAAYQQFTFSGDVVFPASLLAFLIVLAYFIRERTSLSGAFRVILIAIPILWFSFDMFENSVIYYLLSQYPQKNVFLADNLKFITIIKFTLLLISIATSAISYALFRKRCQNNLVNL